MTSTLLRPYDRPYCVDVGDCRGDHEERVKDRFEDF